MPDLPPLSRSSASCRLEWQPSKQERASLALLTLLAAFSLLQCDLPLSWAWPAAVAVILLGSVCLWRNSHRRTRELLLNSDLAACRIDGQAITTLALSRRGPLLFVRFKQAPTRRWQHLVFWPDTLPVATRRQLQLMLPLGSA